MANWITIESGMEKLDLQGGDNTIQYCPNTDQGCRLAGTDLNGELLKAGNHLDVCPYRPIICPHKNMDGCGLDSLKLSEIKNHLIQVHNCRVHSGPISITSRPFDINDIAKTIYKSEPLEYFCGKNVWPAEIYEFNGDDFLSQVFTMGVNIFWIVSLIGPVEEQTKYYVTTTLELGKYNLSMKYPVESIIADEGKKLKRDFWSFCGASEFVTYLNKKEMDHYEFTLKYELMLA